MALPGNDRLEPAVMDRLWSYGRAASAHEVFEDLQDALPTAYASVLRAMERLHRNGWLRREPLDGVHVYEPTASREWHAARLIGDVLGTRHRRAITFAHFLSAFSPQKPGHDRRGRETSAPPPAGGSGSVQPQ
jgi:predicted transcriptional regulator